MWIINELNLNILWRCIFIVPGTEIITSFIAARGEGRGVTWPGPLFLICDVTVSVKLLNKSCLNYRDKVI